MFTSKLGDRIYSFESQLDREDAKEIYMNCMGDQDAFEVEMSEAGIVFSNDTGAI